MNLLFRDIFSYFKIFEFIYERIRRIVVPPKAYSWQTLLYLSVFSLLMSSLSTGYVKEIIAICGWLFLIAGTAWYTTDNPLFVPGTNLPLGALITGFLVSVFAFGQEKDVITPRTIVLWPTISAIITAIPEFFEGTGTEAKTQIPKIEARQRIIVLLASCMVISCWLQFYFVVDNWVTQFPSVQIDNSKRSALVLKSGPAVKVPTNGVIILDRLVPLIEEQIAKKPWSEVEQWLLDARQKVGNLGKQVIATNLAEYDERYLWRVEPRISNIKKSGYKLDLLSIWDGPRANPERYYLKRSCQIDPVTVSTNPASGTAKKSDNNSTIAEITCQPIPQFIRRDPPPQ